MHTFTDTSGRVWSLVLNVDVIRRVRSLTSINLLDAVDGQLIERLITDPILLCDILFAVVQPEAQQKSVSDVDFGRALGGDVLDAATTALLEELVDFFPSAKRELLRKALRKLRQLEEIALQTAHQKLDSPELEARMRAAIESTHGHSSGSSPALQESLPGR